MKRVACLCLLVACTSDRTGDFLAAWRADLSAMISRDCNDTAPASRMVAGVFDIVNPSEGTIVVSGLANGIWFEPDACMPLPFDVEESTATIRAGTTCTRTTTETDRMETWTFSFSSLTLTLDGAGTQVTMAGGGSSSMMCTGAACPVAMQTCDWQFSGTATKL